MKKLWTLIPVAFTTQMVCAQTDPVVVQQVTPLQLRDMQTRKFNKPLNEVLEAVREGGADTGATCQVHAVPDASSIGSKGKPRLRAEGTCSYPMKTVDPTATVTGAAAGAAGAAMFIPFIGPLIAGGAALHAANESQKGLESLGSIKYTMRSLSDNVTVVRMRAYTFKQIQITSPETYAKQFKQIGDSIFVQAIELTPGEQE